MSVSIVVFKCSACGHLGQPESVAVENGGQHRCSQCHHVMGVWLNMGKLDLGLIEDDGSDDYEIFDRPF